MKKWIVSAAIIAAAVFPQVAIAAEAAAEEGGSWSVFAFFAINFILFAAVLIYFAGPPARKFFADRAATIRGGLSRAESAFKDAQDLANKAAAKLAALDAELKQLADEMAKETEFQVARVEEIAKTAQARIRRDTELTTVALSEAAQRRVRERLSDSAATLARELIVRNFERADQGRLIDGFMDKLGEGATR
jgi:F0F1-type ATP synthase membrane subunit b/b'